MNLKYLYTLEYVSIVGGYHNQEKTLSYNLMMIIIIIICIIVHVSVMINV